MLIEFKDEYPEADTINDSDIFKMDYKELRQETIKLRNAIRQHKDEKGHNRCWLDDQTLYKVLPDKEGAEFILPPKCEFLKECEKYWQTRQPIIDDGWIRDETPAGIIKQQSHKIIGDWILTVWIDRKGIWQNSSLFKGISNAFFGSPSNSEQEAKIKAEEVVVTK